VPVSEERAIEILKLRILYKEKMSMKVSGIVQKREVQDFDTSSLIKITLDDKMYSAFSNSRDLVSGAMERLDDVKTGDRVDIEYIQKPGKKGGAFNNIVDIIKVVGLNDDVSAPPRSDSQSNRVDSRDLGMTVGTCMRYAVDLHQSEMKLGELANPERIIAITTQLAKGQLDINRMLSEE